MDIILNLLTTLVGAFAGAWAAFRYQEHRQSRDTIGKNVAAVNRAIYTVYNLWNVQKQFQKEVIELVRGRPDIWLNLPATPPSSYGLTTFQAEELSFLLPTKHAQTYSALMLEEQRFQVAINQIAMRSTIVLNQVFPRLAAAGVGVGTSLSELELVSILGIDVVHKLKNLTEGIIKHIDENEISLRQVHDDLREAFAEMYPKENVLRIVFELPDETSAT